MTQAEQITQQPESNEGASEHITLFAEPIHQYGPPAGGFTITNSLLTSWLAVAVIIVLALILRSKLKTIPGKIQNVFEMILEGALDMCDQVTNDRALSIRIFPIAISVFFFILVNNWLGLVRSEDSALLKKAKLVCLLFHFCAAARRISTPPSR